MKIVESPPVVSLLFRFNIREIKNLTEDLEKALIQINRTKTYEIITQAKEHYQSIQIVDDLIAPTLQNIGDK